MVFCIYNYGLGASFLGEKISNSFFLLNTELANAGRPLFPGNDDDDQLKRIFKYP